MKLSKLVLPVIAVFVLVFIYGYVVHGVMLVDIYQQTPHLWRTQDDMCAYFWVILLSEFGFSVLFVLFYAQVVEDMKTPISGWQYGLGVGAIFAAIQFGVYAYMPISLKLSLFWVVDAIAQPVLCGYLLGCLYKK